MVSKGDGLRDDDAFSGRKRERRRKEREETKRPNGGRKDWEIGNGHGAEVGGDGEARCGRNGRESVGIRANIGDPRSPSVQERVVAPAGS